MMLNLSAALGRLVLSGRELARLSGFSSRVTGLIDVIDDVNRGVHKKGRQTTSPAAVTATAPATATAAAAAAAGVLAAGLQGTATGLPPQGSAVAGSDERAAAATAAAATTAATVAGADAPRAAQERISPPNATNGVGGDHLLSATDGTPEWPTAGQREPATPSSDTVTADAAAATATAFGRDVALVSPSPSASLSVETVGTDVPSRSAAETSTVNTVGGAAIAQGHDEKGAVKGGTDRRRSDNGTVGGAVWEQPELAPEASAGEAVGEAGVEVGAGAGSGRRESLGGKGEDGVVMDASNGGRQLRRSGSVLVNEGSVIEFTDVPLVTPSGEVLIEALSFKVRRVLKRIEHEYY